MLRRDPPHTGGVMERDLLVLSEEPLNAETRLDRQRGPLVPAGKHYVRTHFAMPEAPARLTVGSKTMTLDELRSLPSRTMAVTLECAGNGRRFLEPKVPGEQWGLGAVGTARWTGVPLASLLTSVPDSAVEVLFRGADAGTPKDLGRRIAYERSLPIEIARDHDVIVAFAMDGAPIPREHGGPIRLVVPGWYGMASVKWLERVAFLDEPFAGFFQRDRYVIDGEPLRNIEPRAVITSPLEGSELRRELEVRGYAWSGRAPVERVALADNGRVVAETRFSPNDAPYAWREFAFRVTLAPGEHALAATATDRDGNTQPAPQRWNALGYANNAPRAVRVRVL
jgi:DMSO/TMAO reductase YedYZ molybdopterin-dependent catalytic subunit